MGNKFYKLITIAGLIYGSPITGNEKLFHTS